jgi:hypothetical protein
MPLPVGYVGSNRIVNRRGRRLSSAKTMRQTWTDPRTIDTDGYSASHLGAAAAGTTNQTLGGANTSGGVGVADYARNVVITVTHASSVVAMSGVITGTDIHGKSITEPWAVTATGTSKTFTGAKAFKRITSITEVVAADASGNTIITGDGKVLGLEAYCSVASAVKEIADGSVATNGTVVAASSASTADARGTYAPNATPDGSKDYTIYYLSDDPEAYD